MSSGYGSLRPRGSGSLRPPEPSRPPQPAKQPRLEAPSADNDDAADSFLNSFAGKTFDSLVEEKKGTSQPSQLDQLTEVLSMQAVADQDAAEQSDVESNPMSMDEQLAMEEERRELLSKAEALEEEKRTTDIQASLNKLAAENLRKEQHKLQEEKAFVAMKDQMREKSFEQVKQKEIKRLQAEAESLEADKNRFQEAKEQVYKELKQRSDQLEQDRQFVQRQANKEKESKNDRFFPNGQPMQKPASYSGSQRAWERKNFVFA